uniref:Alpha-ketoglutarate-dependent dioxygenase AlkB-like domain-containing protein n=1 Tax=Rhizophora mucronata TaxID=61149 RepID=A0A2P2JC17_RHIMU
MMDSSRQKGTERNMKNFEVGHLPTLIYIPDFITESEETHLWDKIYEAPLSKWKSLKNRRLQDWGGVVHEKGLLPQDLLNYLNKFGICRTMSITVPPWLTKITQRVYEESGLFPSDINHVLINEYGPNQGIMPHQDGPAYFPVVAILSLGSPVVMDFTPHSRLKTCTNSWCKPEEETLNGESVDANGASDMIENHHPFSVLLMPRSLLIFKDMAYSGKCYLGRSESIVII